LQLYVIDFSRYMPPQPPDKTKPRGAFLYELLRPELVSMSPVPLSPDSFSNMQPLGQAEARKVEFVCFYRIMSLGAT
jgi:hypothetical protein